MQSKQQNVNEKNISNIAGNLEDLASLHFLDLCLLGETGTGKTHTAKLIHDLRPRSGRPMVSVNCAELSLSLIESELFGHEKGAFTGAACSKEGKFEAAAGGALFLDEIGELATTLLARLLKVVEEKCVTRVGGNRSRPVDVRIIYATHRHVSVFCEDIWNRVTSHALYLKPLRQREEEIVALAMGFLDGFNAKSGRRIRAGSEFAGERSAVRQHSRASNVRGKGMRRCNHRHRESSKKPRSNLDARDH